ncbi:MAG TPA: hypothetical protein VJT13_03620, partial [Xanthobacteraceae bacterium]|nr:hypothetical protein [Xanthobacteraceae bacterium]
MVDIAELAAQFADALHQCIVGDCHAAPNRIVELLLGDQAPGVLGQVAQQTKRLRPQLEIASCDARTAAHQVQIESVEAQDPRNNLIHDTPRMNRQRGNLAEKSAFRQTSV